MQSYIDNESYNLQLNTLMRGSKRRSYLGIGVSFFASCSAPDFSVENLGGDELGIIEMVGYNRWKLLRKSKQLLAMRTATPALVDKLDLRRDWNSDRSVDTVLDLFPSLKYSYSSLRGKRMDSFVEIVGNSKGFHITDIARSHSIRLDPVDSPKELFKYKQRIQNIIGWAYANNLVPVMMTLTVFHRWNNLAPLCRVLSSAWSELFRGPAGLKRKEYIGLRGYVRRMEETFNDGDADFNESCNAGWHPHYHVMLLVPRDRVSVLSDYESELREVWVKLVRKYYLKEFGEDIPAAYLDAFEEHGLVFSRYKSLDHAKHSGSKHGYAGALFEVKDGKYLAKLIGTDSPIYGGDSELTYLSKNSKTPFDLLRCEVTANLADLWCEYAIATKKIPCFTFSQGLQAEVDSFFATSSNSAVAESLALSLESPNLTVRLKPEDYRFLYRNFLIDKLFEVSAQGYSAVKDWLKSSFNIDVIEETAAAPLSFSLESDDVPSSLNKLDEFVQSTEYYLSLIKNVVKTVFEKVLVSYDISHIVIAGYEMNFDNKAPP